MLDDRERSVVLFAPRLLPLEAMCPNRLSRTGALLLLLQLGLAARRLPAAAADDSGVLSVALEDDEIGSVSALQVAGVAASHRTFRLRGLLAAAHVRQASNSCSWRLRRSARGERNLAGPEN